MKLSANATELVRHIVRAGIAISEEGSGIYQASGEFSEGGRAWHVSASLTGAQPQAISVVCDDTETLADVRDHLAEAGWTVADGRAENSLLATPPAT